MDTSHLLPFFISSSLLPHDTGLSWWLRSRPCCARPAVILLNKRGISYLKYTQLKQSHRLCFNPVNLVEYSWTMHLWNGRTLRSGVVAFCFGGGLDSGRTSHGGGSSVYVFLGLRWGSLKKSIRLSWRLLQIWTSCQSCSWSCPVADKIKRAPECLA